MALVGDAERAAQLTGPRRPGRAGRLLRDRPAAAAAPVPGRLPPLRPGPRGDGAHRLRAAHHRRGRGGSRPFPTAFDRALLDGAHPGPRGRRRRPTSNTWPRRRPTGRGPARPPPTNAGSSAGAAGAGRRWSPPPPCWSCSCSPCPASSRGCSRLPRSTPAPGAPGSRASPCSHRPAGSRAALDHVRGRAGRSRGDAVPGTCWVYLGVVLEAGPTRVPTGRQVRVQGRTAVWLSDTAGLGPYLWWDYAPGAQATLGCGGGA